MLSLLVCPKVITLSVFYYSYIEPITSLVKLSFLMSWGWFDGDVDLEIINQVINLSLSQNYGNSNEHHI